MSRIRMQVYSRSSKSAIELAKMLGIDCLKIEGSTFRPQAGDIVINYGSATLRWRDPGVKWLNHPHKVRAKTDKRDQLRLLWNAGVRVPAFTESLTQAVHMDCGLFCRVDPESSGGKGIVYMPANGGSLPQAALYVQDVEHQDEFRVHVFGDTVIGVRKKLRANRYPENKVRSWDNGYFFSVKPARIPADACLQAVAAVRAVGLDFGGVDIGVKADGTAYVFEVNAAPGLDGPDFDIYAEALKGWIASKEAA